MPLSTLLELSLPWGFGKVHTQVPVSWWFSFLFVHMLQCFRFGKRLSLIARHSQPHLVLAQVTNWKTHHVYSR